MTLVGHGRGRRLEANLHYVIFKKLVFSEMATAAEKRDEVKARLQELRNMCRDLHATVMEEGSMPDAADVRATNDKLQELSNSLIRRLPKVWVSLF